MAKVVKTGKSFSVKHATTGKVLSRHKTRKGATKKQTAVHKKNKVGRFA
jgi:hypothetical protein